MREALLNFSDSPVYLVWMIFLGAFPIITAMLSIDSSRRFILDRESKANSVLPDAGDLKRARKEFETLSVLIPARNEELLLGETIESVLQIDWPRLEIIVVDDGSTDGTVKVAADFITRPARKRGEISGNARGRRSARIRIFKCSRSRGKAEALNLGTSKATGKLILGLDADGRADRRVAEFMIPHFVRFPRVAAVTGNPRVVNTVTVLARLQAIEFASTVAVLRRAQAGWGRINTVSGICVMFRGEVPGDLGGFDPGASTEDIMMSWIAQLAGWDLFYEPRALFGMHVPTGIRGLFRQRQRWGRGLGEVLRTCWRTLLARSSYRMWPVALESALSIVWCLLLILAVAFWALAASVGLPDLGNSPLLSHWGIIVVIISILQIAWGIRIDATQDRGIWRMFWVAPLYPLFYWLFVALASVTGVVPGLILGTRESVAWNPDRPSLPDRAE